MGACAAGSLILLSRATISAYAASPIRKHHDFSLQVATSGEIETPDGRVNLTAKQSVSPVRSMVVDAEGNIETGRDKREMAVRREEPVAMLSADTARKIQSTGIDFKMHAAHNATGHPQRTSVVVRKRTSQDARGSDSISSLLAGLVKSSERGGLVLRNIATVLQSNTAQCGDGFLSRKIGVASLCFFSMVAGCLAAALASRPKDLKKLLVRAADSISVARSVPSLSRNRMLSADSDGECRSSDEDDRPFNYNIRTASGQSFVLKSGLLWKLERRFIDDLRSHSGSGFDPTDRFAFLESWDLRFFSLDVENGAVRCSYVSELNEFTSVVFQIKSIDTRIIEIPTLKPETARANKNTKGAIIELYGDYLAKLCQIGYKPPESGTCDPESLFVFIIRGVRQGEIDGSRSVGRLKFFTERNEQMQATIEDAELSHMALAATQRNICKRWHEEISSLLSGGRRRLRSTSEKFHY